MTNVIQACEVCPSYALFCKEDQISLQNGYWRENDSSDFIENCDDEQISTNHCKGEIYNLSICDIGFQGPLCQSCQNFGLLNDSQLQISKKDTLD